jgi:hypothetical protein
MNQTQHPSAIDVQKVPAVIGDVDPDRAPAPAPDVPLDLFHAFLSSSTSAHQLQQGGLVAHLYVLVADRRASVLSQAIDQPDIDSTLEVYQDAHTYIVLSQHVEAKP